MSSGMSWPSGIASSTNGEHDLSNMRFAPHLTTSPEVGAARPRPLPSLLWNDVTETRGSPRCGPSVIVAKGISLLEDEQAVARQLEGGDKRAGDGHSQRERAIGRPAGAPRQNAVSGVWAGASASRARRCASASVTRRRSDRTGR